MLLAYLPFDQFFGDETIDPSYIKQARLRKNNRFGLPAGDYILHDLYATDPSDLPLLYFIVEHAPSGLPLLTAHFNLDGDPPELTVSPRHLQSDLAPEALDWAMSVIDTEQTYALVMARYEKLMLHFAQRLHDSMPPEVRQQVKALLPAGLAPAETGILIPFPLAATQQKTAPVPQGGLHLRIVLLDAPLPVWREVTVPASLSLNQLHQVIQTVMGWENAHLWEFQARGTSYVAPLTGEGLWLDHAEDASQTRVVDVLKRKGSKLSYLYDMGDHWEHEITLQARLPQGGELTLLDGENACPPEDCGGVFGYAEMLRVFAKKRKSAADRELLAWLGEGFDPSQAHLPAARKALKRLAKKLGKPEI